MPTSRSRKFIAGLGIAALAFIAVLVYGGLRESASADAAETLTEASARLTGASAVSEFQASMLADGKVTENEYVLALETTADCIDDAGYESIRLGDPLLEGELQLGWIVRPGKDESLAKTEVHACMLEYLNQVEAAFHYGIQGTPE